jgi:thymine-DNA glycosylase
MWVMPSSSARCAQLPRAADKVPFYAALKKFRDYLNGLVPEYDENDYVFNDPKYSQISTEAELKSDENLAFTALENGEVVMVDPNKKKRGRPKKIRGENGEEIPSTPKSRKTNNNNNENINSEGNDDESGKKKRGRPKKNKDGTTNSPAPKKKANKQKLNEMMEGESPQHLTPPSSVPPQGVDMNSMQHLPPQIMQQHQQQQQHPGLMNNNCNSINRPFLPPMESPSANNYNGAISQNHLQQSNQQSQNASPVNLCFPPTGIDHVAQPEMSPHLQQQQYQQRQTPVAQQQIFATNSSTPEVSNDMSTEPMTSPISASPALIPTDFEPPINSVPNGRSSNELNPYSQMQQPVMEQQQQQQLQHPTHSPSSQTQSPHGMPGIYPQQHQQPHMIANISNGSPYSPYSRQHSQQQQQAMHQQQSQQPIYPNHQQSPHHHAQPNNNVNTKQVNGGGGGIDPYKDVATKSLSGLESLVDQIPNLNEQEAGLGSLGHTVTPHNGNLDILSSSCGLIEVISGESYTNIFPAYSSPGTPNLAATSPSVASSSSILPSLGPPHHHSHYSYSAAAAASQSPYSANPFSVSNLASSSYPSAAAAAMNSYHQNLMSQSHLTSSFMEPPHMPVPVTPLYHYQQQQGYPGYAPPHPSALHMSNYPYSSYPASSYPASHPYNHSMFDRINF